MPFNDICLRVLVVSRHRNSLNPLILDIFRCSTRRRLVPGSFSGCSCTQTLSLVLCMPGRKGIWKQRLCTAKMNMTSGQTPGLATAPQDQQGCVGHVHRIFKTAIGLFMLYCSFHGWMHTSSTTVPLHAPMHAGTHCEESPDQLACSRLQKREMYGSKLTIAPFRRALLHAL